MDMKDSLETSIILNFQHEYQLFKEKNPNSLIKKWFINQGIKRPIESVSAFKYDIVFIGSYESPRYTGAGIIIYPSSPKYTKIYIGQLKGGKRHGKGWRFINNELFIGSYQNDEKTGPAIVFEIKDQKRTKIFDGAYSKGEAHGQCYIKEKDHVYEGKVVNGTYHGFCKITYPNGDYFEGTMFNGKITGNGMIKYSNGDVYRGGFVDNKRYGEGSYEFQKYENEISTESSIESVSSKKFKEIERLKQKFKNFRNRSAEKDKDDSMNQNFQKKSFMYTDWKYSSKRPRDELN